MVSFICMPRVERGFWPVGDHVTSSYHVSSLPFRSKRFRFDALAQFVCACRNVACPFSRSLLRCVLQQWKDARFQLVTFRNDGKPCTDEWFRYTLPGGFGAIEK